MGMSLEEMKARFGTRPDDEKGEECVSCVEGEAVEDDDITELDEALMHLQECLFFMSDIKTTMSIRSRQMGRKKKGRRKQMPPRVITEVPENMDDLMEEVTDFLEQWGLATDPSELEG
jgi:hypothetical protein